LRVSLQHVGFDYLDETLALLRDFPNVYLDMSVLNSVGPPELHSASLRRIVEAGFADRIMLGSDDQDLSQVVARVEGAAFLTAEQRRGIYYDNAARFASMRRSSSATTAADQRRSGGRPRHQPCSPWLEATVVTSGSSPNTIDRPPVSSSKRLSARRICGRQLCGR
jgi:hypothetical protein